MAQDDSVNRPYARRLLCGLLWVVVGIAILHLVLQYMNLEVFLQQNGAVYELSNRFDMDDEHSVPTWVAQAIFAVAAVGAFLVSRAEPVRTSRRVWVVMAVVLLALSIDEVSGLHEYILQLIHVAAFQDASPTLLSNAWWIVMPVIIVASVWYVWRLAMVVPRRTVVWFALSGALYVAGAIVVDALTSVVARGAFLHQGTLVAIEESVELVGSTLIIYAIVEYVERYRPGLGARLRRFVVRKG